MKEHPVHAAMAGLNPPYEKQRSKLTRLDVSAAACAAINLILTPESVQKVFWPPVFGPLQPPFNRP
jgi:hypothetical protein